MQCNLFGRSIQLRDFEDELKTWLSEIFLCPLMLQTYYHSIALAGVSATVSFYLLHPIPCCSMVYILAFQGFCNSVFFSGPCVFCIPFSFSLATVLFFVLLCFRLIMMLSCLTAMYSLFIIKSYWLVKSKLGTNHTILFQNQIGRAHVNSSH